MYKILIVDDESFTLSAVAAFIRDNFPAVTHIDTFQNSMDALRSFQESPADIVITDIRMPVLDGLELIQRMRQLPHFFVPIIISGHGEFSYAKQAMELEVMYYILKPLDFSELRQNISAAMEKVQQNSVTQNSASPKKLEQELFFVDLICHRISTSAELCQRFSAQAFPFSPNQCPGIFLRIHVPAPGKSPYQLTTFSNVWENLIRMVLQPRYVCTVFRAPNYYDLILIRPEETEACWHELCQRAELLLHVRIETEVLSRFASLLDFVPISGSDLREEVSRLSADHASGDYHRSIRMAITYMESHYAEDLTREGVAELVFMSGSYFSKLFKQETGMGFSDYLTQIRMKQATILMRSNMRIQDIAKAVGYNSQNRFLINFRNYTSFTPSEYRREVLKLQY